MTERQYIDRQFDLFLPYVTDLPLRDQRETMERPFFSLSKKKRLKPIDYKSPDGKVYVRVTPNSEFGMATIWDADILIWAASMLTNLLKSGVNDIPRTLHCQPYDILKTIGRSTGGNEYRLLREALSRLQATSVATNIRAEKTKSKRRQFSWIESFADLVDENEQVRGLSITLADWFIEGVTMEGGILAIDPAYFSISSGRARWLYRVARKHAGGAGAEGFSIPMRTLFEKSGAEGNYRRFKFEMLAIARRNDLPEYALRIEGADKDEPQLRMVRRDAIGDDLAAIAPAVKPKVARARRTGPEAAPALPLFNQLTEETIAKVRRDFPGWDVYALKGDFDDWIGGRAGRIPADYQAAFYGFVKQYNAKNRHTLRD